MSAVATKPRILIIDDESAIRQMLKLHLGSEGFEVAECETGAAGLKMAEAFHPHLMILDLGLPDLGGLAVLKKLRQWTEIPILILTVNDDEKSKIELLDAGADDYLTKPFAIGELMARLRVALRRHHLVEATPVFVSGSLRIDINQRKVCIEQKVVRLTSTEFELLARLVREAGRVVPQLQLLKDVWGPNSIDQVHYLRIYIGQLRKKIEPNPGAPTHILTEPGVGYRIV